MTTPATRMTSLTGSRARTNERGSSESPSSPSSRTKPPIGSQLSVQRVSPFERRTLARGGKPMPNSRTRTPASRAVTKWPSSWMTTSEAEHPEEDDDRDERLEDGRGHRARRRRPGRERGADLRVERDELIDGRAPGRRRRRTGHGRLEEPGDAGEVERAVEEPGDGDLVGGDERGRGPRARSGPPRGRSGGPGTAPRPGRGSRAGRSPTRSGGGGRRRVAVGVGQGVLDGKTHVGGAQLGLERAVHELDGRVDDALGMDDHVDRVVLDIVQPVCLDDLQALVGEGGRIDRDLGAHRARSGGAAPAPG